MKVVYDPEVDSLSVLLSNAPVAESDQDKPAPSCSTTTAATWWVSRFSMLRSAWRIPCPSSTPLRRHFAGRHEAGVPTSGDTARQRACPTYIPLHFSKLVQGRVNGSS